MFIERSILRELAMLYIHPVLPFPRTKNSQHKRIKQEKNQLFTNLFLRSRNDRMLKGIPL
jgi:hypothetical protein